MIVVRDVFYVNEDRGLVMEIVDPKTGEIKQKKGRTKQADKDSCDINFILARYQKTGMLPDMIQAEPKYGDFSDVPSFQEACEIVSLAQEQFEALDAKVRQRFNHDPKEMLAFVADKANEKEMVELGLALPKPAQSPTVGAVGVAVAPK
nr:MAG: internal scaffolding protein [Microvirus sp.]